MRACVWEKGGGGRKWVWECVVSMPAGQYNQMLLIFDKLKEKYFAPTSLFSNIYMFDETMQGKSVIEGMTSSNEKAIKFCCALWCFIATL